MTLLNSCTTAICLYIFSLITSCGALQTSSKNDHNPAEPKEENLAQGKKCKFYVDKSPVKLGEEIKITFAVDPGVETAMILDRKVTVDENQLATVNYIPQKTLVIIGTYELEGELTTCEVSVEVLEPTEIPSFNFSGVWESTIVRKNTSTSCDNIEFLLNVKSSEFVLNERVYNCDDGRSTFTLNSVSIDGDSLMYIDTNIGSIGEHKISYGIVKTSPNIKALFEITHIDGKILLTESIEVPKYSIDDHFVSELTLKIPLDVDPPVITFAANEFTLYERSQVKIEASVTDATAMTYKWEKVSGSDAISFAGSNKSIYVYAKEEGVGVFSLTATDIFGNTSTKLITVTWDLPDAPINFVATVVEAGVVRLTWDPNPANQGAEKGYVIEVGIFGNEITSLSPADGIEQVSLYKPQGQSNEPIIYVGPETEFLEVNINIGAGVRNYRIHSFDENLTYSSAGSAQVNPSLVTYDFFEQFSYDTAIAKAYSGLPGASDTHLYVPGLNVINFKFDNHYLKIIDISDPTAFTTVNTIAFPIQVFDVLVDGTIMYVATASGLKVYDISVDPVNPTLVADEVWAAGGGRLQKKGGFLYFKQSSSGIFIYDVSDALNGNLSRNLAIMIDDVSFNSITDMKIVDNHFFVATMKNGVYWYDVTDPSNPAFIYRLFSGKISTVQANSEVVCGINGAYLECYDLNETVNPVKTSSYRIIGTKFLIIDSRAYILSHHSASYHEIDIVDISLSKVGSRALGVVRLDSFKPSYFEVINGKIFEFSNQNSQININTVNDFNF